MDGLDAAEPASGVTAIQVYAVQMGEGAQAMEQIERWLPLVPADRAERVARFRHWEDAWRSLAGDILVRQVLQVKFGVAAERNIHRRDANGKPGLCGGEVQYNVSHSGKWVVAAFHSSEPVGIDIERIGKADLQLAKSMFARSEYDALRSKPLDERDRCFYAIWTAKESYIKADGRGLSIPLDSFHVDMDSSSVSVRSWQLRQFELDPAYALTVCGTTSSAWPGHVLMLDASAFT